ncbi:hypothetical protein DL96DRAFT_483963 [Flagelloscypha sp. PMI_526]|nr:hypothetical protein DL96DRAFT_483963 [Flagelloscypha sp. PMI_526]
MISSLMSLKEEIALEAFHHILYGGYITCFVWALCHGILLCLSSVSLYLLQMRASKSERPVQVIRLVIIILTVIATVSISLNFMATLRVMSVLQEGYHLPLQFQDDGAINVFKVPVLINYMLSPLIYAIADVVPLWRAWVLWQHSPGIKWFLIVVSILNAAICVLQGILMSSAQLHKAEEV